MKRLLATLRCDIFLQVRNGFYAVSLFVLLVWVLLFSFLPRMELGWVMPILILGNLMVGTFFYIGGLVLLEKSEGTLEAQVVTPLRRQEYLAAKVISLTLLAILENLLITFLIYGLRLNLPILLLGLFLAAALFELFGFAVVIRYDSVNEYIFPAVLYTMLLSLPLIDFLGLWQSPLFYLHPIQAPLLILKAAFEPVPAGQLLYGLAYSSFWIWLLTRLSQHAFYLFITSGKGRS